MSWADHFIADLAQGRPTTCKPSGNSMIPLIYSKDEVLIYPVEEKDIEVGDVLLCKVRGNVLLHKVHSIKLKGDKRIFTISNNKGFVNGTASKVYGRLQSILDGKGTFKRN